MGQRGQRTVDLPHEVYVDDALELLRGRLLEGGEEPHRGEVHPGVEPTVFLYGAVGHRPHLPEVRGVGDHGRRLAAIASYLLHQGDEPFLAAGGNHHLRAPLREPERRLPSYAAGGTHQGRYLLFYRLE